MPAAFPAAVVRDWGKLEIADIPALPLGPYDCACKILACATCAATDSHLIEGSFPRQWCATPPFALGHESAGRVVAIGPKVRNYEVGQLVVRPMWQPDTPRHGGFGASWGGFSSWGIVRDIRAWSEDTGQPIPMYPWRASAPLPEMPARDATLFVTWRDAMGSLLHVGVKSGQRVAIFGTGGNGLAMTRFASLLGAKVVVVGSPTRFARAQKLGAIACVDYRGEKVPAAVKDAFGGHGADVVIEAVGAPQHLPQLTASLANGGKLFLFGVPGDLQFPANLFDGPEQFTVVKKFHDTEPVGHEQTLKFYLNKQIDPADFCDGEMPLEKIGEAFAAIRRREAIKITITMPQ